MIKKVRIFPKEAMKGMINEKSLMDAVNVNRVCIISILDICGDTIVPVHDNTLTLEFHDIGPRQAEQFLGGQYGVFDVEQARQIIAFVYRMNKLKDMTHLFVHCSAGISRSGAVGRFVAEWLNHDMEEFGYNNPNILPNTWVESLLWRVKNDKP